MIEGTRNSQRLEGVRVGLLMVHVCDSSMRDSVVPEQEGRRGSTVGWNGLQD